MWSPFILAQLAHQQRYCVVIVTHNLAIAERSDRVWTMSDGALTEKVVELVGGLEFFADSIPGI